MESAIKPQPRSHWRVTWHVYEALFLREAVARISADRIAWFWLVLEPIAHVGLLVWVRNLLGRVSFASGAEYIPWLVVGITLFIAFRNQMTRGMEAVAANRGLFAYRQVQPVDTVLVRCHLEALLSTLVIALTLLGVWSFGYSMFPRNLLSVLHIWCLTLALGSGVALIFSVVATIMPEAGKFVRILLLPLYFLSGIMVPVQYFSHDVKQFLLYNPLVHAVELFRLGFFPGYRALAGVNEQYIYSWVLSSLFLGLLLHIRFKVRLKAQ